MVLKLDPSKITNKYGLATVITLAFETLFFLWFQSAENSMERIAAGILAAVVLIIFLFRIFAKESTILDTNAKKLVGKWNLHSESEKGTEGSGTLTITHTRNQLVIFGVLYEGDKQVGVFNSEVTRVNENRLIFYYVLRDRIKSENMDAVSILVFDPNEPNELKGDWIVASKTPRHGSVTYTRVSV